MPRTGKEIFEELSRRLDRKDKEEEQIRERIRSIEKSTARLHGLGAAIRWIAPSALSIVALFVALKDRTVEPSTKPSAAQQSAGDVYISATGGDASPWVYSGIDLAAGRTYEILASGRATMAIHHIADAAKSDIPPTHPWLGPNGIDRAKQIPPSLVHPPDSWRLDYKLSTTQEALHGMLLAYVGKRPPAVRPAEGLHHVGSHGVVRSETGGQLWFAVNDVWLDPDTLGILMLHPQESEEQKQRYKSMFDEEYYKAWFDDNAGGFFIRVREQTRE